MRRFLWQHLPIFEGEGASGGATPPAAATPQAPSEGGAPNGASAEPAPAGAPEPNGSMIPGDEAAKPTDPAAKPAEAAEALDLTKLTLPEGLKADDPGLAKLGEILGNAEMKPQERAQALLDHHHVAARGIAEAAAAAVSDNYRQINEKWRAEVAADPVIGGANQAQALGVVAKALDTYGDGKALREVFALTGAGNNPHVIRLLHTMATQLGEGKPAHGSTATPPKTMQEIFYGNSQA